jgi:opacity protein-like surface antigen
MTRILAVTLIGTGLALPTTAHAQEARHWYGSIALDISLLKDTNGVIFNAPVAGRSVQSFNPTQTGVGGSIALGYDLGRVRFEVEGGYTRNTDDRYVSIVPATGTIPATVKRTAFRGMANVYYDVTRGPVQPYVGAGLGGLVGTVDFFAARAPLPTEAPRQLIKASDTRFAYQLIGGVAARVAPRLMVTAQYRWLDAGTLHPRDVRGERTSYDYRGHHVDLGARIAF